MIKPAATSVSSGLAVNLGGQPAPGDDTAVSADFAALLDSTRTAGLASGQDGAADQPTSVDQALGQQIRQAAGSPAGKTLPLGQLDAASALNTTAATAGVPAAAAGETAPALPTASSQIILPGLVLPAFAK